MDIVELSRMQFALTAMIHFLFVPLTLGLAFLKNGPERIGETVKMVDHMRGVETLCEVIDPVVFDPEGGRLRG